MSFFIQNSLPLLAVRDNVALKKTAVALHFRTEASSTFKNITVFGHDTALVFFFFFKFSGIPFSPHKKGIYQI